MALLGELIVTLQFYATQCAALDRVTITDKTNFLSKLEKKAKCKKLVINIVVNAIILSVITEIIVRTAVQY